MGEIQRETSIAKAAGRPKSPGRSLERRSFELVFGGLGAIAALQLISPTVIVLITSLPVRIR